MLKEKLKALGSFRIVIGLAIGVGLGALFKSSLEADTLTFISTNITQPIGTLFLRGLFMVVVPLVLSSLAVGIAQLGTVEHLGRLGKKLAIFYFCTTFIAVMIGQTLVLTFTPGEGVDQSFVQSAQSTFAEQTEGLKAKSSNVKKSLWPGLVETIVPKNIIEELGNGNMMAVIFIAMLLGTALLNLKGEQKLVLLDVLTTVSDISIMAVGWVMKLAPYAVACLMFNAVLQFDVAIIHNVAKYFIIVVCGYLIHIFVTYALITKFILKLNVRECYTRLLPIFITAFSTSSSNATLPTTISTLQKRFGIPERITTFTAPLGATINMDGTALFEMVAAVFIAQVFGIELSTTDHVTLVFLIILTSAGVGGVPGGSIPVLMSAMAAVGIPAEGIALILGVDRLLDMGRTVLNTVCDGLAAIYLSRIEKIPLEEHFAIDPI